VTIWRDPAAAQTAVQAFVKAHNDLNTLLRDLTRSDAEGKSGVLVGDSAARTIQSQVRATLSSALAGGNGSTLRVLSQVGVSFQKDGSLALDTSKLTQALTSDPAGVARLFASGGAASDSLIKVASSSAATVPGTYAVDITEIATRGQLVGSAAAALSITAGLNDALTVSVDGTSANVTLPAGTYTPAALAAQIQSLVNASSSLTAANRQIAVSEAAGVLTLTSKRYGSESTVSVSGSAAASLFGGAPTATPGVDVAGTIGGLPATGSGQRLTASDGSPVTGLQLDVIGGSTGSRGTIGFTRGYAGRLESLMEGLLGSDGTIASRTSGINATIKDLDRQRDIADRRLAQIEQRYRKQFTALDTLMSSMTATSSFLTQQLAQLQRVAPGQ
jgi:flagellar hook-associated protein 2